MQMHFKTNHCNRSKIKCKLSLKTNCVSRSMYDVCVCVWCALAFVKDLICQYFKYYSSLIPLSPVNVVLEWNIKSLIKSSHPCVDLFAVLSHNITTKTPKAILMKAPSHLVQVYHTISPRKHQKQYWWRHLATLYKCTHAVSQCE
jgi:hypothetical protein